MEPGVRRQEDATRNKTTYIDCRDVVPSCDRMCLIYGSCHRDPQTGCAFSEQEPWCFGRFRVNCLVVGRDSLAPRSVFSFRRIIACQPIEWRQGLATGGGSRSPSLRFKHEMYHVLSGTGSFVVALLYCLYQPPCGIKDGRETTSVCPDGSHMPLLTNPPT